MKKVKIIGFFIVLILIALLFVSQYVDHKTKFNNQLLETVNQQKAFTQEISKHIFYIYKNKTNSTQLNILIDNFLNKMKNKEDIKNKQIVKLWNQFYLSVQKFREEIKVQTAYSNIILEKTVNQIYNLNLKLIAEFNKVIKAHKLYSENLYNNYKAIQYLLFLVLLLLIIFFLYILSQASSSLEVLMNKIDYSIKAIDQIETQAENILDNVETTEDEDIIIQALDELMISSVKLKQLKNKLKQI